MTTAFKTAKEDDVLELTYIPKKFEGSEVAPKIDLKTEPKDDNNIFYAPENAVLVHSCNCVGRWGSGMAAAMAHHFPGAHREYWDYCDPVLVERPSQTGEMKKYWESTRKDRELVVTAQLISAKRTVDGFEHRLWIGCLFTSEYYRDRTSKLDKEEKYLRDEVPDIIENTINALSDLLRQIRDKEKEGEVLGELRTYPLNSRSFGVDQGKMENKLLSLKLEEGMRTELKVYTSAFAGGGQKGNEEQFWREKQAG